MPSIDLMSSPAGRALAGEIARSFHLDEGQAQAAINGLIPELVAGIERNTLSKGGIADLLRALATGGHARYLDAESVLGDRQLMSDGQRILTHLFASESAAQRATRFVEGETGVSRNILWQILPGVAALLIGWIARSGKGLMGEVLEKLPQSTRAEASGAPARPVFPSDGGRWAQPKAGGDIFPPAPDFGRIPKSESGPYGDLSDILRRGGGSGAGGGGLASIIRNVLGGLLGFGSKGIVSWIIRFVVMRYGWRILSWVVRRMFLGR